MATNRLLAVLCVAFLAASLDAAANPPAPAPNGITLPKDYKDWRVIAVSDRRDNNTLRAIIGNDVAISAARAGRTNPWPEGAVIGKIVWKIKQDPLWPTANVPGDIVHVEFMAKDSRKFPATGNWGFSRWRGMDLQPHGKDASFVQECFGCHTPAKGQDYVFTRPAPMP